MNQPESSATSPDLPKSRPAYAEDELVTEVRRWKTAVARRYDFDVYKAVEHLARRRRQRQADGSQAEQPRQDPSHEPATKAS